MNVERVPAAEGRVMVRIAGPNSRHVVVLLPDSGDSVDVYDAVSERLHNSELKTVALESLSGMSAEDVLAVLEELDLKWVHIVGSGAGAEIAWQLASQTFGRFASLVAVDRGHPSLPNNAGVVALSECAATEIPTTVIVTNSLNRSAAEASGRLVYGDFRIVQLDGSPDIASSQTAAFATEIVLRTSPW